MIRSIAIVGRPNVGKSSLFNALINKRKALTSPNPGLTRDRSYAYFNPVGDASFILIDTGGLIIGADQAIDEKVNSQVDVAIDQADLILFVVDSADGVTSMDEMVADKLRGVTKPIILVANKADSPERDIMSSDFWRLGFEDIVSVSAVHRRNIQGITEKIIAKLPDSRGGKEESEYTTLCIAGKPNTGKSMLVNRITGTERVIVDSVPGTTRNPARSFVDILGEKWELVDLAGMWRKKKSKDVEEVISMLASRREIAASDICVFLLDLTEPLTFQDKRIAGWIIEGQTSVVVAGNKADLVDVTPEIIDAYRKELISRIPYLEFAPFVLISAKTGLGIKKLFSEIKKVKDSASRTIPQEELDQLLGRMIANRPPPETAGVRPVPVRLTQEGDSPPVFKISMKHYRIDKLPEHWRNYAKNYIMNEYKYYGAPVTVKIAGVGRRRRR
ncbi:MAG: ribosome biogenesis GTPase Der [Elusimicrobia bacterium]|nr:ribosome biogenesis GTPase Der [Elusimicrobiota bacterium]